MAIRYIYLFITIIVIVSCGKSEITDSSPVSDENIEESIGISYLALGDSYTIGENVSYDASWPNQLVDSLQLNNITIDELQIIARTGWTTSNLIANVNLQSPKQFDLVSLSIGVNNQYQNKPFSVFELEFDQLIEMAIELTSDSSVFVISIPDYGVTPFGISRGNSENVAKELNKYNNYMKLKCSELSIAYIDITEISRQLESDSNAVTSDNLHPSSYQYSLWVSEMLGEVITILSN